MNVSQNRPASPIDAATVDIKKFISFLKGDHEQNDTVLIPRSMSDYITEKIKVLSPIKSLAKVTYTSNDKLDVVVENEEAEQSGWITNNEITCNEKNTISKVSIYLHQLFSKPKVTQSLLDDNTSKVEEFIGEKITSQMAASENKAFLFGDGITQPKGILKYEISIDGPKANHIEAELAGIPTKWNDGYDAIVKVMEKLPSKYLAGASWIMSRNAASHIRSIKDKTTGKYVWQNSIAHGVPDTLLGYPVIICDDMPKLNDTADMLVPVLFANLYEGYQIAEKQSINILKDPYISKPFVEFYATKRVGGDVVNFNAIKALVLMK